MRLVDEKSLMETNRMTEVARYIHAMLCSISRRRVVWAAPNRRFSSWTVSERSSVHSDVWEACAKRSATDTPPRAG